MKKLISHILIVSMLISLLSAFALGVSADTDTPTYKTEPIDVWDGTASTALSGSGTATSPYLIQSAEDLAYLSNFVNNAGATASKYYKMTCSIDLANLPWTSIGNYYPNSLTGAKFFFGFFDGCGYSIYNLNSRTAGDNGYYMAGLFGLVYGGIYNLGIESGTVTVTQDTGYGAGLVAFFSSVNANAVINNCYSKASVNDASTKGCSGIGGIVGGMVASAKITNSINYGLIDGDGKTTKDGSLVGIMAGTTSAINCHDANAQNNSIFGIKADTATATNCYSSTPTTADGEDFINATERGAKWGVELTGADVALGESIEVRYYAHIGSEYTDSEMTFAMNDGSETVKGSPTETANEYMFVFDGIAPQCMGDNVSATLTVDGKTADTKKEYSVLSNLEYLLATYTANEYAEMRTLIYDLLAYGAAAQQYKGYKTDALVNAGYEDKATDFETVSAALANCEKDLGEATDANNRFAAAGVNFSSVNKVYYKIKTNDISKITLTVGEVTYTAEDFEASGAYYIVYADAATPTEFGVAKLATLKFDGQEVQTLSYSINSYIHSMKDNTTMQTLVKALYCYGVSAASYAN